MIFGEGKNFHLNPEFFYCNVNGKLKFARYSVFAASNLVGTYIQSWLYAVLYIPYVHDYNPWLIYLLPYWAAKQQTSWVIASWWFSESPWRICITLVWPRGSLKLGLNRTSRPVRKSGESSNVRIPDFRFFSFPDSGLLTLLKFKKSPSFSRWSLMAWFLNPFLAVIFSLMSTCKNGLKRFPPYIH